MIDGRSIPETLMQIVKEPLARNPNNSVIAFKDNSSAMRGYDCWTILPGQPGKPAPFQKQTVQYHIIFTAETHGEARALESMAPHSGVGGWTPSPRNDSAASTRMAPATPSVATNASRRTVMIGLAFIAAPLRPAAVMARASTAAFRPTGNPFTRRAP